MKPAGFYKIVPSNYFVFMKVAHPGDPESLDGGIKTAMKHQRKVLDSLDVSWTAEFDMEADILHVNVPSPKALYYIRKAKKNGLKTVFHAHEIGENFEGSFRFSSKLRPIVERYINYVCGRVDLVITPSPYAANDLRQRTDTEVRTVTNGIDTARFEDVETNYESFERAINLSLVFERKGLSDFIETAEKTERVDFKWYGKSYSSFLLSGKIKRQIEDSPDNVDFPGYIESAAEGFNSADAFLFPTKSETFGLSVFEAAYCGLPPVIRDIPIYKDWFTDGENCLKARSPEGFSKALRELKEDRELREKIGQNAKALAEEHTLDALADQLNSLYKDLDN